MKVLAECEAGTHFWGKINGVGEGFTEGEVHANLNNDSDTAAQGKSTRYDKTSNYM